MKKIELVCYTSDGISYRFDRQLQKYRLESPLTFVPYELMFDEEKMESLIKILLNPSGRVKITIEVERN